MARFLSEGWFAELGDVRSRSGEAGDLVVEQVVTGTPDGEVRYRVVVGPAGTRVVHPAGPATPAPQLTFTVDYQTAAAIAKGEMTTHAALGQGRVKVTGSIREVAPRIELFAGLDLVPAPVRASTTY